MDVKKQVHSLLKEASIYDAQGLYDESKARYLDALQLIQRHAHEIDHHKEALSHISSRIKQVSNKIDRMGNESDAYQMPNIVLDVMKNHFSSSTDKNQATLEGAMALATFGQYESALEELAKLLKHEPTRLEASKQILRCHLSKGRVSKAVDLFTHWQNSGVLDPEPMSDLRTFFQALAEERHLHIEIPGAEEITPSPERTLGPSPQLSSRQYDAFHSMNVKLPRENHRYQLCEFKIRSQSGDIVNLLVSNKEIIKDFRKGAVLDSVQCFSTNAMFSGKATVVNTVEISSGAMAGHFSIDIRIHGI